ncbi:MAG: hypothetical protein GC152_10625 [Alphaproteobacteria bacterium]|nr:hypothetical protein [Alphaproteobacteria bacterium]
MTRQNRVSPYGEIVANPARGTLMGNRGGCIHDDSGDLERRRWASRAWIACRLEFNDHRRQVMAPGRYTELFFLDEATALAAGQRPCFECRREDALNYVRAFARATGATSMKAPEVDAILHGGRRAVIGEEAAWQARPTDLPDGTIVDIARSPHLWFGGRLYEWTFEGYRSAPWGLSFEVEAPVLTPRATVGALRAGYAATVHASARIAEDARFNQ